MQSGMNIGDDIRNEFQQLRMKRAYRYIIYAPSADKSTIEVEKFGDRAATFDDFKAAVAADKARWLVYELEYQDGPRKVSKILFITFAPDNCADNTEKFVVACNKDALKTKVSEVNPDIQVNSWDDLVEENFVKKFNK